MNPYFPLELIYCFHSKLYNGPWKENKEKIAQPFFANKWYGVLTVLKAQVICITTEIFTRYYAFTMVLLNINGIMNSPINPKGTQCWFGYPTSQDNMTMAH
ncbi:hypothetical protein KFK09_012516 [Dendrobium nobile]|uniref:Uncharacterized protein n=1 Tax=Dendrobium nobile TaxID=94219 RepID=A0A8T3BFP2_DENNO|nr:hypothetical protein KFK09_012516 [Dendrobium nobile]